MFGLFKSKERKMKEKELKQLKKENKKAENDKIKENARKCRKFKATTKCYPILFDEIDEEIKVHITPARANVFAYNDLKSFEIIRESHPTKTKEVTRLAIQFNLKNGDTFYGDFIEKPIKIDSFKYSVKESVIEEVANILNKIE